MLELTPSLVLNAYAAGLFPMAEGAESRDIYWYDPEPRGILPLDHFHLPHRLKRTVRHQPFVIRCNTAFAAVIAACAETSPQRASTWINGDIQRLYRHLHAMGFAHSVECWQGEYLVGGLYGVSLGGAFFGESMFSRATNASKIALVHLVARLRAAGYLLLDTQFVTDHLRQFGAIEIPRADYRHRLTEALAHPANFHGPDEQQALKALLAAAHGDNKNQVSGAHNQITSAS